MQTYDDMSHKLADLITTQLRLSDADLPVLIRKMGRRAPRHIRRDLTQVADAARLGGHPKLAAQIDPTKVQAAFRRSSLWLKEVDIDAQRAQARRMMWAGLALKLMLILIAGITALAWLGLIGPDA